jgi:hypothetical protein
MWPYVRSDVEKTYIQPEVLHNLITSKVTERNFLHEIAYTSHTLPKKIMLGNAADTNPYHLFFFMLARFYFFDNGGDIVFYYSSTNKTYLIESAFKHLPKRFIRETEITPGYEYIEMPGCNWYSDRIEEPWIYEYVRDLFKEIWSSVKQEKGKYTYISRNKRDISNRRCLNEDELLPLLKEAGFSSYNLDTLTFEQQIKLFRSSEIITGVHGAGLAWLIFCEPGTSVVEIQHPSWKAERGFYIDIGLKNRLQYNKFINVREPLPNECENNYNGTDIIVDKQNYIDVLYHIIRQYHQ